jgi:signal transduction histidine kinase
MVEIQTLMISLLLVEGLLVILMLITAKVQKNYPGFNIWVISIATLAFSNILLISRGIIPELISILLGNLMMILGLLLIAESLHRFYTDTPLNRWFYCILLPVSLLLMIFTQMYDNISVRSLVLSVSSVFIILVIIQIIRTRAPAGNLPSLYLIIVLSFFAIVMAIRGIEWFFHPAGRNFFESTALNIGLYGAAIIGLLTITFMYILLNFHRLANELQESHLTASRLLADLDLRNRDLEHVTTSLYTLNKELDQKVQDRTKRISNLLLQKDQFITMIAHDLRTPLTPLVAVTSLLKQGSYDDESNELVEILDKNVRYLRNTTEQLIKLANLNSQNSIIDYDERNLAEVIHDAIKNNQSLIENFDITTETNIPGHLTVCVSKIFGLAIFSNIINNAVKYNVKSGRITITGTEEGRTTVVSIADSGKGMSPEEIEKIWGELYVCDSSRSDPVSKGLGLSMVKKIVDLHGGDISA